MQETDNTKYAMKVVGRLIKIDDQALLIQDILFENVLFQE